MENFMKAISPFESDIQCMKKSLNKCEAATWGSFKNVVKQFQRKEKSEYSKQLVSDLLQKYRALGCNMSLKIHFLDSHLNFSLKILKI